MDKYRAIPPGYMTAGEAAKKMGVTVRTLQYYDKAGLLPPSAHSAGGRRLYSDRDLIRLHQILSLKSLGFSLEDIQERLMPLDTPQDVAAALMRYIDQKDERRRPDSEDGGALFISAQNRRLTVRAVENLVKKYARIVSPLKKISPHKLRSTYGTQLYKATGDIYIVADILGHKDVNTTRKHYAAISDDNRRSVVGKVKLTRPDDEQ